VGSVAVTVSETRIGFTVRVVDPFMVPDVA